MHSVLLWACVVADVKFDAVSGNYYPILYFNDYWNLQKDYYPINETVDKLPFRLSFCPLSLWRWQLYAAQSTKSPWNFLGEDLYEQSDEEQDSVKVGARGCHLSGWNLFHLQHILGNSAQTARPYKWRQSSCFWHVYDLVNFVAVFDEPFCLYIRGALLDQTNSPSNPASYISQWSTRCIRECSFLVLFPPRLLCWKPTHTSLH